MSTINPTIKHIEMIELDIAVRTTCEAMMALRFREEAEFKRSQGWEPLLRQSQYKIMNRYVDRVVLNSPESKAYSDARKAWNDRLNAQ